MEKFVGGRRRVVLPVRTYRRLLEDLSDLRVIAERRAEKPIPLKEFEARLGRRGLLSD